MGDTMTDSDNPLCACPWLIQFKTDFVCWSAAAAVATACSPQHKLSGCPVAYAREL
jgi:hypothetical protein